MRPSPRSVTLPLLAAFLLVSSLHASEASADDGYTAAQKRRVTPVVELVRENRGAVVNISATQIVTVRDMGFGRMLDFFDTPFSRRMKTNSVGSGAVIHPAGYVLTNAHVVAQASELKAIFADGSELPAEIVATLPEEDLAILRVHPPEGRRLQAARLGTSSDLMVGETVIAIGNPLGLQHSVTSGIVSAVGRELRMNQEVVFQDIIQTDAAINPGNSGGPLLNILGEVVGVNTAIRGDAQNVGFAIPVDRIKALLPELLRVENQGRIRFGIQWGTEVLTPDGVAGVTVAHVESDSPAGEARIEPGAVVTSIAGKRVEGIMDALVTVLEQPVGRPFSLAVEQNGRTRQVRIALQELPMPDGAALARERLGLGLVELDARLARRLGLRPGSALFVKSVERGGPAARAGIEEGDLVTQVGRYGVRDLEGLGLVLENVSQGDSVLLTMVRVRGRTLFRSGVAIRAR